jgi:ankyrin repeat protein
MPLVFIYSHSIFLISLFLSLSLFFLLVQGHEVVVQLLLKAGANPRAIDDQDETCLHAATLNGRDNVCEVCFFPPQII